MKKRPSIRALVAEMTGHFSVSFGWLELLDGAGS